MIATHQCKNVLQYLRGICWASPEADPGEAIGVIAPTPLKPTKVTLYATILHNSENSIRDIRSFCRPMFCHSSIVKYTYLSCRSKPVMILDHNILLILPPPLKSLAGSASELACGQPSKQAPKNIRNQEIGGWFSCTFWNIDWKMFFLVGLSIQCTIRHNRPSDTWQATGWCDQPVGHSWSISVFLLHFFW